MKLRKQRARSPRTFGQLRFEKLEPRNLLSATTPDAINPIEFSDVAEVSIERTSHEQSVRNHLAVTLETSHLQTGKSDLRLLEVQNGLDTTVTFFQQTFEGTPVFDAYIGVVQGANGEFERVINNGVGSFATFERVGAHIGANQATLVAVSELGERVDESSNSISEDVWYLAGNRLRKAIQIDTLVGAENDSRGDYQNVVDTHTGNILQSHRPLDLNIASLKRDANIHPRIVTNDATGATGARAYAAPFDAVAEISFGCTATLIAPSVLVAARHCGGGAGDTVRFGDDTTSTYTGTAASVASPAGSGSLLDGGDFSIWTLTQDVPANIATPMKLIDGDATLEGEVAVTVGYGWNGLGSSGHQGTADGWRWGGENIIDAYGAPVSASGANIFSTDFDDGTPGNNTIPGSDPTPLQFEATTAPGDSGGPLLVQAAGEWVIAGVLSGGTNGQSLYGDISWWTGVGPFAAEIEAAGGVFVGSGRGTVALSANDYQVGDAIDISVTDANAIAPIEVTLTSDSGDTETLTLASNSSTAFSGSIITGDGSVSANDGTLQVTLGDQVTVTYVDPDNGNGGSTTHTDVANISNKTFFPSEDIPVNIPNESTITSEIIITESGELNDVDVELNISHTWAEDLDVFLIGPDGSRVELFTDVGDDGVNFSDTILDDEAATPITSGASPFAGSFRPEGSLGVFDGMQVTGTWTLEITDDESPDPGTLNDWGLFLDIVPDDSTITLPAGSLTTTQGDLGAGDVDSLATSDDMDLSLRRSTSDVASRTQFEIQATSSILNPTSFEFTLEGSVFARTNVNQSIELFDYDAQLWVIVDSQSATRFSDSVVTISATGDLTRFVDTNGDVEARITFQSDRARQRFTSFTDHAFWTITG